MNETSIMHIVLESEWLKAEVNKCISKGGIYPNDIPGLSQFLFKYTIAEITFYLS